MRREMRKSRRMWMPIIIWSMSFNHFLGRRAAAARSLDYILSACAASLEWNCSFWTNFTWSIAGTWISLWASHVWSKTIFTNPSHPSNADSATWRKLDVPVIIWCLVNPDNDAKCKSYCWIYDFAFHNLMALPHLVLWEVWHEVICDICPQQGCYISLNSTWMINWQGFNITTWFGRWQWYISAPKV